MEMKKTEAERFLNTFVTYFFSKRFFFFSETFPRIHILFLRFSSPFSLFDGPEFVIQYISNVSRSTVVLTVFVYFVQYVVF